MFNRINGKFEHLKIFSIQNANCTNTKKSKYKKKRLFPQTPQQNDTENSKHQTIQSKSALKTY